MSKVNMIRLVLTSEQRKSIEPLLELVRQANLKKHGGAIVAQVYSDGLVARFITADQAKAVSATLCGDPNGLHTTAASRVQG